MLLTRVARCFLPSSQKYQFKNDPTNKGKFIDTGLWALSRHPNYLGELGLWWALAGVALPVLRWVWRDCRRMWYGQTWDMVESDAGKDRDGEITVPRKTHLGED